MKKVSLVLVLTCLLLFTVFGGLLNIVRVRGAEATTYIRDDGSVEGTITTIETADNVTYTFTDKY